MAGLPVWKKVRAHIVWVAKPAIQACSQANQAQNPTRRDLKQKVRDAARSLSPFVASTLVSRMCFVRVFAMYTTYYIIYT